MLNCLKVVISCIKSPENDDDGMKKAVSNDHMRKNELSFDLPERGSKILFFIKLI